MVEEARLDKTEKGVNPASEGWFVMHTSEAPWIRNERIGLICNFAGKVPFAEIGFNLRVLEPGQPASLYHRENGQEDFYVISGECALLVEEEERHLRAGHFVHCPPETNHVFVGAGDGPCVILMVGHRPPEHKLCYPVSEQAAKYNASASEETTDPREAYKDFPEFEMDVDPVWPLP